MNFYKKPNQCLVDEFHYYLPQQVDIVPYPKLFFMWVAYITALHENRDLRLILNIELHVYMLLFETYYLHTYQKSVLFN